MDKMIFGAEIVSLWPMRGHDQKDKCEHHITLVFVVDAPGVDEHIFIMKRATGHSVITISKASHVYDLVAAHCLPFTASWKSHGFFPYTLYQDSMTR
jgi:hypothetical protein